MPDFVTNAILNPTGYKVGADQVIAAAKATAAAQQQALDSVEKLARQFRALEGQLNPVIARENALYEVTELATRAQLAGIITDKEAIRTIEMKRVALEAETLTYQKVIVELAAETATMRVNDREREISAKLIATENRLKQAGVAVSAEQRAALQAEITTQVELGAARTKASGGGGGTGGAIAGIVATLGVGEVIHLSDAYTGLQNRIRLVTDGEADLKSVSDQLFQVSQETRFSWEASAETYQRLTNATQDLGLTERHRIALTKELNELAVESGVTGKEAENGLRQLAQGLSAGALRGQDLRAALEDVPALGQAIAKGLGVSVGALRELGEKGKLTADMIVNALDRVRGDVDQKFGKTTETVGQSLVRLKNAAEKFSGELLTESGLASGLANVLSFLADHMDTLGKVIEFVSIALGVKFALGAVRAAIEGILALDVAIASNPLGMLIIGVSAAVAAFVLFGDEIKGVLSFFTENVWAEAAGSVLLLLNPLTMAIGVLGLVDSGLKLVGSSLGGLTDWLGITSEAFGDFREAMERAQHQHEEEVRLTWNQAFALGRLRAALKDGTEVTALQAGLMLNLGDQIKRTTDIAQAFVAVDVSRQVTELVTAAALVGQIKHEIDAIQAATARQIGTIARDQARTTVALVQRLQREARQAATESKALDRELASLEGRQNAASDAALKLATAYGILERAVHANKITMAEANEIRVATIANVAAEEAGKSKLIDRERSITAELEAQARAEQIRADISNEHYAASIGKTSELGDKMQADLAAGKQSLYDAGLALAKGADDRSPLEGMRKAFSEIAGHAKAAGVAIKEAFVDVFGQIEDKLVDLVVTGKASFADLTESIFRMLTKILLDQAFARLIGILGLGSAGGAAGAFAAANAGRIPGHATGIQYMVGGSGSTDNELQMFRATRGERVTVETPAQQIAAASRGNGGGGGGLAPVVRLTAVNVLDPRLVPQILATPEGASHVINSIASRPEMARAALRARRG
jgi:lambda family phage tail tape measure protein